ncbi:MAG: pyridine nucleotide-disulfide oxidoreductase [Gammaproteobacteria bacterium SG8_15]|nr:MAG: pyridine nucleotide-disulfide oxidoreductase [Gammaproteobacteria bacterium SG8_15]
MSRKIVSRLLLFTVIALLIAAYFIFDLGQYLTLDYLKSQQDEFISFYQQNQLLTISVYFGIYIAVTALSLPGAAIMTLAGGAVFGVAMGTLVVSFASTIGATLAFLFSRFLLRNYVQKKFQDKLVSINDGIRKDGPFYLFTLRLIPIFPFFIINLVMGVTPLRTWQFFWVSQIGMLPGTIVYVNAGSQIAAIDSLSGILSPGLLVSFALLGLFPLLAKKLVELLKTRKYLRHFLKPRRFDYNMVVIGAGSAGLVSAYIASAVKAKVALVEKHKMGGDCLNTGCVPSKALIRSTRILNYVKRAREFGFKRASIEFSFADVMERVQRVIKKVEPHDSVERYTRLGVECIKGEARIITPYEVRVNGRSLITQNIVIATGARPFIPDIDGLEMVDYLTSDTIWNLRTKPEKMIVLGGGPIGSELAQCFQRLGSQVTIIDRNARLLNREDKDVSLHVMESFRRDGIQMRTNHAAKRVVVDAQNKYLVCEHQGKNVSIEFDEILIALGRKPNVEGFGMEELNIHTAVQGNIETDEFLRTNYPNIYACGDVAGPYQFTHMAAHQAWYAAVNSLFKPFKKFRVNYSIIPWATYTDPEVARVGLNETDAKAKGIPYEVTRYGIEDLDRAIADEEDHGLVKVLTEPGKDRILGVTIVGHHAGELIAEFVTAMTHGLGLEKILNTIHIYPTLTEANKYVAGNWKKSHKPERVLSWLDRFHRWRRLRGTQSSKLPSSIG